MQQVQEAWTEEELAGMLLKYVKRAFDHVSRNYLMRKMKTLGADGDLVRWTGSFLSKRMVSLVVDGHQCVAVEVDTGVPQRSPVSHILFAIYLSGIFEEVKEEVEECMATSFADDCGWLVTASSVAQLWEQLG